MSPPVIGEQQQPQNKKGSRPQSHSRSSKRSDLVCRIKYNNSLPDIPFDAKFLAYPFESNRFVQYNATSLERNFHHELLTETDLGLPIDLIDPDIYKEDRTKDSLSGDPQHETDAHLMEDEITPQPEKKRSRQHAKNVSWLRKTEYISTEYNRFQTSSENLETK
jgi:RNA polymerase II-associated factor 1